MKLFVIYRFAKCWACVFWQDVSIDFGWKWSEHVTKPLLVCGSTKVHQEAGTLVEGPGVRRRKWIGSGAFWLNLSVFAFTLLTSHLFVLRTPSLSTGPASMLVASWSSWARGSSGKPSVSRKVCRKIGPCKTIGWWADFVEGRFFFCYKLGNNISGDLWNLFSCVVPLTHPQQTFFGLVFCPLLSSTSLLLCKRLKAHGPLCAEMCAFTQFVPLSNAFNFEI